MSAELTTLERAIVAALEAHPSFWVLEEFQKARVLLSGPLSIAVEALRLDEGQFKAPTRAERAEFLLNLSKWFSGAALAAELLATDLHAAARGSTKDLVAALRSSKPRAQRRTGAGERP